VRTPAEIGACPFAPLCERELSGPALDATEEARLEAHLDEGCAVCEGLVEANLSGSSSDEHRELDQALGRAVDDAAEGMAASRAAVLARVEAELKREHRLELQRLRRRHLRAIFYVTNIAALVLLVMAYVGTVVVVRVQRRTAQRLATATELRALVSALSRWVKDHPGADLPVDMAALVTALSTPRPAVIDEPPSQYYPFDPERLKGGVYVDDFGRPYRLETARDRALVYSTGIDGLDQRGEGDDFGEWVRFVDR
jgi:hypothetical protein